MAPPSHSRQLRRLVADAQHIGELHRKKRDLERAIRTKTRKLIKASYEAELNNADIARMIGEVGPEAIRQAAKDLSGENPRALGSRRQGAPSGQG